jgi:hypothetical protein
MADACSSRPVVLGRIRPSRHPSIISPSVTMWFRVPDRHRGALPFRRGACFSWQSSKSFQDSSSHRIYRHMYRTLNIDKKIINYIVCL